MQPSRKKKRKCNRSSFKKKPSFRIKRNCRFCTCGIKTPDVESVNHGLYVHKCTRNGPWKVVPKDSIEVHKKRQRRKNDERSEQHESNDNEDDDEYSNSHKNSDRKRPVRRYSVRKKRSDSKCSTCSSDSESSSS